MKNHKKVERYINLPLSKKQLLAHLEEHSDLKRLEINARSWGNALQISGYVPMTSEEIGIVEKNKRQAEAQRKRAETLRRKRLAKQAELKRQKELETYLTLKEKFEGS